MAISRKTVLSRLIDSATQPVYALDEKQRLVYCNDALARRLGATAEELVGSICQYVTTPPGLENRQSLLNGLCPGPHVFLGREELAAVLLPQGDHLEEFTVRFLPFTEHVESGGSGSVQLVLAVVQLLDQTSPVANYHDEIRRIRQQLAKDYDMDQLIGVSPGIQKVHRQAKLAAAAGENVLLLGPPGTGKERLAQAIHYAGQSDAVPMVSLACHFLDDELLRTTVLSLVQQANDTGNLPTLLLTEAHELAEEAQHELLRLIATAKFRIMVTATVDGEGQLTLLPDVVDSVSTFTIEIPGLGQRPEDVRLLAEHFLEKMNTQTQKRIVGFDDGAIELLMAHSWPGNRNELNDVIAEAHQAATGVRIVAADMPRFLRHASDAAIHPPPEDESIDLDSILRTMEIEMIVRALRKANSNKAQAARLLGIQRNKLLRRIEQLEITNW
jgi:transcriptional regulator with PAS, ATPase and Fis domain